jgi:hypothetical protein
VTLGKGPSVNFSTVKAFCRVPFIGALGKGFVECQEGTRQRKVGCDGADPLTVGLPSAGPAGTRQIFLFFFEKLCRVPRSQALGKFIFLF